MGLFANVQEAEISQGGVYFEPGLYMVRVALVKTQRSQRNSRDYFISEHEILHSNNPKLTAGRKASQVIDISNVMGPSNIKAFVAAASGVDPSAPDVNDQLARVWADIVERELTIEEICEFVVGGDNPLEGVTLFLEATEIRTRAGNPFTKHFWHPVTDENEAELLAKIEAAG